MARASLTPVILSGLVFPGAGQAYLKRWKRAAVFIVPTVAALFVLMGRVIETANKVSDMIVSGQIPVDINAISAEVTRQGAVQSPAVNIASLVVLVCWIASAVDAWRISRQP
ncbi:MAG: DUF6677 family protein [Telluria sp.]